MQSITENRNTRFISLMLSRLSIGQGILTAESLALPLITFVLV